MTHESGPTDSNEMVNVFSFLGSPTIGSASRETPKIVLTIVTVVFQLAELIGFDTVTKTLYVPALHTQYKNDIFSYYEKLVLKIVAKMSLHGFCII